MSKPLSARELHDKVKNKLKHYSTEDQHEVMWLDTGEPELHSVLGSRTHGLAYGRMVVVAGNESQGKTLLMLNIAAAAQADGAYVGLMPLEDPLDENWCKTIGLDPAKTAIFETYLGKFEESKERLIHAEELFDEAEHWMERVHAQDEDAKIFLGVDSLAAVLTEKEDKAGITGQNMLTNNSTPIFLSRLLKRWSGRAKVFNAMIFCTNQIRLKPAAFGNPEYMPAGKAVKFSASAIAFMRRKGDKGRMTHNQKMIGVKGILENTKNKVGWGSVEGEKCGYKLYFNGNAKFIKVADME